VKHREILDALSLLGSILELGNLSEDAKKEVNQSIIKLVKGLDTALAPLVSSLTLK